MHLISKKELLAITGISYGQLYRWKRERLIPEEWFIKKSSFTGQETFFPRDQILSRVQSILDAKSKYSLEELASILSPEKTKQAFPASELKNMKEINSSVQAAAIRLMPEGHGFTLTELGLLCAISQAGTNEKLEETELDVLLKRLLPLADGLDPANLTVVFYKPQGAHCHGVFVQGEGQLTFDPTVTVIGAYSISEQISLLKIRYRTLQ